MVTRTVGNVSECAIIRNNALLLLWKKKPKCYEMPGGKVDPGESLETTAQREAREEIGCDVMLKRYLGGVPFEHEGRHFQCHQYLAEIMPGQEPRITEPDVFEHLIWMPMKDYQKYSLEPRVREFCEDVLENRLIL